ncbi:MAG: DUF368 domain-containing protein [Prolixibacteraceae bacterium]|nr:DUF368 domain-containing protein [Prolixibacteraceae bacterium]
MKRKIKDYLVIILKGIGMGAADVIPGVSGGTIAFITGIYEELVNSIKSINGKAIKLFFQGKLKEFWESINGTFLLSVVFGIGISIFSLAKLLEYLLREYPILIWSFFFGLIIASAVFIGKSVKKWNAGVIISAIGGIIIAYFITIISPAEANTSYWFIFLSGAIAICAMILPGISGSFILVLLGMYKFILEAVGDLNFVVLGIFLAGALVGIITFSNILSWFLKKYHDYTIALLAGFMLGSLNKVWPWKETAIETTGVDKTLLEHNLLPGAYEKLGNDSMLGAAVLFAVLGFILIFLFEKFSAKKTK